MRAKVFMSEETITTPEFSDKQIREYEEAFINATPIVFNGKKCIIKNFELIRPYYREDEETIIDMDLRVVNNES